jgi:hypothetical protein
MVFRTSVAMIKRYGTNGQPYLTILPILKGLDKAPFNLMQAEASLNSKDTSLLTVAGKPIAFIAPNRNSHSIMPYSFEKSSLRNRSG